MMASPIETGSDRRSPHHSMPSLASVRRKRSRTDGQRFLAAAIQYDEKLIVAPAPDEVSGPQRAFQCACHHAKQRRGRLPVRGWRESAAILRRGRKSIPKGI